MAQNNGWIKIHRKMLEWEWYHDKNVLIVFVELLLRANYKDYKFEGKVIERGQVVIGISKLAKSTTLTFQQTRTALDKLKSTNEITIKSTNKYSVINIVNYNTYQDYEFENNIQDNIQDNKRTTNEQQTNNKQITTSKERKKERKEEKEKINKKENIENFIENFFKETIENLKKIIEQKREMKIQFTSTWENDLIKFERKLMGENKRERITKCVQAIDEYTGLEFFPIINDMKDFCKKFSQIENYTKKTKPFTQQQDGIPL